MDSEKLAAIRSANASSASGTRSTLDSGLSTPPSSVLIRDIRGKKSSAATAPQSGAPATSYSPPVTAPTGASAPATSYPPPVTASETPPPPVTSSSLPMSSPATSYSPPVTAPTGASATRYGIAQRCFLARGWHGVSSGIDGLRAQRAGLQNYRTTGLQTTGRLDAEYHGG